MKTVLALIAVMGLALPAFAQDAKKPVPKVTAPLKPVEKAPPAKGDNAGQPNSDEMMKVFQAMAAPVKQHEAFKEMVGTWQADVKHWMAPGTEPGTSTGTMTNTLIHGGRYVHHEFKGEFMGGVFTGSGDFGYNKATEKYEGTWMDSFGTAIMFMSGTYDEKTKTYTSTCEMDMPGPDGKLAKLKQREVVKIEGPDKHVMEMYQSSGGQPEVKVMEITYTRVAKAADTLKPVDIKPVPKPTDHK